MTPNERIQYHLAEVAGLCYEISANSEADCFFNYSPHVNYFDVHVYESGWAKKDECECEVYASCTEVTQDNLMDVLDKLYALRAKMGGGQ